jgi:DNA-binding response OmpR family regulator
VKPNSEIKILIVEDDVFFRRVLEKRLAGEGYLVCAAADGREGMKSIVTFEPDLVISDWMMPHVDGLELCQSVKTGLKEAAPYFILLTAKGEVSDRLLGLETGADDYLVKPCDQGELMARVRAGLRIVLMAQDLRHTIDELRVVNIDLAAARDELNRVVGLLPRCCVCQDVRTSSGTWKDLDTCLANSALMRSENHMCPKCQAAHHLL